LITMKGYAVEMRNCLLNKRIEKMGQLLHENWLLKKKLSTHISNPDIDKWYDLAMEHGALGGKLCGAGGGGFLLFYCPPEERNAFKWKMPLRSVDFKFEPQGSRIIYVGD
jgi:D-glycero-alpha-D-manno-heptose-7-phosphate kinase